MTELYITKATPNPAGKDHAAGRPPTNDQLNGEWLEFKNTTQRVLSLDDIRLVHNTFNNYCTKTGEATFVNFKGGVAAGKSIRVHSGSGQGWWKAMSITSQRPPRELVWNNKCGDTTFLRNPAKPEPRLGELRPQPRRRRSPAPGSKHRHARVRRTRHVTSTRTTVEHDAPA